MTIQPHIDKLGVIAGSGELPSVLIDACDKQGIKLFIVGFDGQTSPTIFKDHPHLMSRIGEAGSIIGTLQSHDVHDIVMIGAIQKPSLQDLKPDLRTARFFAKLALKSMGDNSLLTALRQELEAEGFKIHGAHKFVTDILAELGTIGKHRPKKQDLENIKMGFEISQTIGKLDIGQSVVVQNGYVLGVEAIEGTDALITRCGALKRGGRGPILIKSCKPQQDMALDLPTIGRNTAQLCAENGYAGMAIHAGHTLLAQRKDVLGIADKHKMFVWGASHSNE